MNNTDKTVIKFRSFFCFLVKYLILIIPEPPLPLPFLFNRKNNPIHIPTETSVKSCLYYTNLRSTATTNAINKVT